jgi:ADP-ribosylglycohydrolase
MSTGQNNDRLARAHASLEGLSVGDAFGERFFAHPAMAIEGVLPAPPWSYTDDTHMALSIVAVIRQCAEVDRDLLARSFAQRYREERWRGYGPGMHRLLPLIAGGGDWRVAAHQLFGDQGSFGNGAAMRVAPLGAFFADDLDVAVEQAQRSAEVTHAHAEGIAGAVAVAIAAAWACRLRGEPVPSRQEFIDLVLPYVPDSKVRSRIQKARDLPPDLSVYKAVAAVGNGGHITAQDTVPYVLWCAGQCLDRYEQALWLTASGLGDIDTTCAMVGGIVAAYTGVEGIPASWLDAREPLPDWPFFGDGW